jgi:hypothetical protein
MCVLLEWSELLVGRPLVDDDRGMDVDTNAGMDAREFLEVSPASDICVDILGFRSLVALVGVLIELVGVIMSVVAVISRRVD